VTDVDVDVAGVADFVAVEVWGRECGSFASLFA
jgi:hypothetical protein